MTLEECFLEALKTPELVKEFDRLRGTSLQSRGLNEMIDIATGKRDKDLELFVEFFLEVIWIPLAAGTG